MKNLSVRTATLADYNALCPLYQELDNHHINLRPDIFKPFYGPTREIDEFAARLENPNSDILVAIIDDQVCGFADIEERNTPQYPMFIEKSYALIDNLIVARAFQRQGIATALFEHVKVWAKGRGLDLIRLKVYSDNTSAKQFYLNEGFQPLTEELELSLN